MGFKTIVSAAVLSAVALGLATNAAAQRNNSAQVVVVDFQRIAGESAVGRDMGTKLQGVRTQLQQEAQALQPEAQAIETERQRLAAGTRGMTPQQIQANTTWRPQFEAFNTRVQQFQQRTQSLNGDFECSQAIALRSFEQQILPVVRTVMQQRGAGVAIDAGNAQVFEPQYDVTNTVIQQLDQNAATRTATVARHALSECQPQQQQQPAAAPAH